MISPTLEMSGSEKLSNLLPEPSLQEAVAVLARLAKDRAFLDAQIFPLLEESQRKEDWYVAHTYEGQDSSYSLQVFVWPPGTRTQIHDHTSWGAYYCLVGSLLEERYERLGGSSRPDHARLKKAWQLLWSREDGASTILPHDGGIHSVGNPSPKTAISVHLYGPKIGEVDGRNYDLSRNYVCDRVDA